jgi:Tfp pilus assembly protein FimT
MTKVHSRSGFTLVELSMSIGIGMLVAIAAFAAVDAASKTIARSKQAGMEVDMMSSAIRWIRNESGSSSKIVGLSTSRLYHEYILDVAAGQWPAQWPELTIQRVTAPALSNAIGGGRRSFYHFTIASQDGAVGAQYLIPITSLP